MWILTPLQPGGETHYLLASKEYVVGRKNCDILLSNDQSISRAHAQLVATDQTLILKDTSKYGTFVNSQRLTDNTAVNLKSGDNVTFGVFDSKFSVDHQKPVVCSSCMDNNSKALLSETLLALGGKLINTWSQECTHLVMTSAKVTIKTICALLCCCPIVKPEFFSELSKAAQQKLPPPKAESFIPDIDEPSLSKKDVDLGAIPARKQIFSGKTFIFLSSKQLKRLSAAVSLGGGRAQLLEEGSLPREVLESPHSCVIDVTAGSSQPLLPSSTTEWATSVKKIVQRKGLRVITESEIGLAAIYVSCDQYCNPSSVTADADPAPTVNPRIPSASLSQSVAVEETVLPAASQNITAYAVNTEPSQGAQQSRVSGAVAVGETPEKKQNRDASQPSGSKLIAQKTDTQCVVADTMSSSYNTVAHANLQRKRPESSLTGSGAASRGTRSQLSVTNGGASPFQQKWSPQKPRTSPQTSPQKQSTLTSFFQPVSKKRPLEDEPSAVMSEPKRPVPEPSNSIQAPNASVTPKETGRVAAATPPAPPGAAAGLYVGRSAAQAARASRTVQQEPWRRKRKEMEAEIQMDELESIMSEDMDCFDEPPSDEGQQAQPSKHSSAEKKRADVVPFSASKKQRVTLEENGTSKRPQGDLGKESASITSSHKTEQHIVSVKTEQVHPSEYGSSKPPEASWDAVKMNPLGEDEASFVEDVELLQAEMNLPDEETKTPLKPVTVKQEVQETEIDEDLPKKLVLVEFRCLTVAAPPKVKPQKMQEISRTKNFKCFRKSNVPGVKGSTHIIGGSDLLVHTRGKNSELDEWLKDAAEEERQSRRDESLGDDLFRYNPTKLSKRR